jgi:hypothetical protein
VCCSAKLKLAAHQFYNKFSKNASQTPEKLLRVFSKRTKGMKILKTSSESRHGHVHFDRFFLASNDGWIEKKKRKKKDK